MTARVAGLALAALVAVGTGLAAVPARADWHHDHDRRVERRYGHDRHWRDWHDRGRVYYGPGVYVDPPPVVYGPPPAPGVNLMFSFGR